MALLTTYATLVEFKTRLNIASGDVADDGMLETILDAAADCVDSHTRQPLEGKEAFSATTSETRYFDDRLGDWPTIIYVDDVLTVTAVTRGGNAVTTEYWQLWPYNPGQGPYQAIQFRPDAPQPANNVWYAGGVGLRQLAITGTWGYCTAVNRPATIKEMTLRLAVSGYETQNLSSEELLQALNNPVSNEMKIIAAKLRAYRREVRLA